MPSLSPKTTPYYGGGQVNAPADVFKTSGAPSTADVHRNLGSIGVDNATGAAWILASKSGGTATWTPIGGGAVAIDTLTGDSGGAISPVSGNIDILGTASQIVTTGTAGKITASLPVSLVAPGSVTATTAITANSGDLTVTDGDLVLTAAGAKLNRTSISTTTAAGANSIGTVLLVAGTATIASTSVNGGSLMRLTRLGIGATGAAALGNLTIGTIVDGVSFVITAVQPADSTAAQTTDVSIVLWEIIN